MKNLMTIRRYVINFISKYDAYLKPIEKLLLALISFILINSKLGYMEKINSSGVVLIAALMCSFMPYNFIILLSAIFILLHMYALSLECAAVVLVLFVVLFLLYFRLSPNDTIAVILTPITCLMGVPYVMPVAMGLTGGIQSMASVGCGVIVTYVLKSLNACAPALTEMATDDMASRIRFVIDSVMDNKAMVVLVVSFAITILVVHIISKLPVDYSWYIAIAAGALTDAIVTLIGSGAASANISVAGIFMGTILALVIGVIVMFFKFNVDYRRTEKVQFEDDEYVYYVKAVPKIGAPVGKKGRRPAQRRTPSRKQQ